MRCTLFFWKRTSRDSRPEASIGDMSTNVLFDGNSSVPKKKNDFHSFYNSVTKISALDGLFEVIMLKRCFNACVRV